MKSNYYSQFTETYITKNEMLGCLKNTIRASELKKFVVDEKIRKSIQKEQKKKNRIK